MTEPAVHPSLTDYQEQVLADLRAVVSARAAAHPVPLRSRRPRLVAATAAALTVAGTATASLALTGGGSPAYAVEKLPDGGVRLTIRDAGHLAGLPEKMTAAGLPTKVVPVTPDCPRPRAVQMIPPAHRHGRSGIVISESNDHQITVSLFGGERLPAGAVVIIGLIRNRGTDPLTVAVIAASGDVTCLPADGRTLPPTPAPGAH